jgi:DNA polymerase-3 subunit gamma/tau
MSFHRTYRPPTLDQIVGHKAVVTRLQGIIKSERYPSAMLFIGPSSAGKTTLARAFATDVNQLSGDIERSTDYKEVNAGADRSIEDIRNLVQNSKFMPSKKKRIIVIDEAQQLVSNAPAAAALLKPLEEPSKNTIWILCSMDADKFRNGNGKAIANRCTQFILEPHTEADLLKQALRIAKAEKMTYVMDEERTILKAIVANSNGEMRTLANQMEAAQQYYEGLSDRPKRLTVDMINNVLAAGSTEDEQTAGEILWARITLSVKH